jgi:hypothetical protein
MSQSITRGIVLAGLVLSAGIVAAMLCIKESPNQNTAEEALQAPEPTRAELVTRALAAAYPGRIEKTEPRDEDWAMLMDGVWYYYAEGKLLPEDLLENAGDYSSSFGIPNYQIELPPWKEPSPEQAERLRDRGRNNNSGENSPRRRSYNFREDLWQAHNYDESYKRVKSVNFLGKTLVVHSGIAEKLSGIEERIMAAADSDPQLKSWLSSIGTVSGWSWRNIAGSQSRSFHAYGIAIDILPKSLGGKETYWQWARERRSDWWNIPYTARYHPPDAVIKAFESYGFIWGGKWPFFDTMHFEYRPEVFTLSGLDFEQ